MTKLKKIERDIAALSPEEVTRLREWFEQHEADGFDQRIKSDASAGRLDALAETALAAHRVGEICRLQPTLRRKN